ncbi:voltage-gated hydrogen channel 1 [Astyanax mexicanus]|uniref:Voltage-gated hydrogen channel 1 n=1 Tax=Astyanax mexicanus TaxID=7994 RepID=W5LHG3_ASTMX|nr:voltage-gated hydrogen channel 1 [Astyanax mexicanus]XP_007228887.2 voltage-gated hydrogen channel 1 [Astyanax mexicanus]
MPHPYLRFFTAVGDNHQNASNWHKEELHETPDELEQAKQTHVPAVTFRDSMKRLFSSERFQIAVVCLVVLDALFVLCELLIDLSIIKADEHRVAPQVFHYLSLALLTFFMVELLLKLFAYRLEFFKHKFEVFDGIVVVVSFVLDIVYISKEDAFDGMGFLILLRLWRVARIINGILVTVENRAHHKVQKVQESNDRLVQQVNELQEQKATMEHEISRLRALLKQHNIQS